MNSILTIMVGQYHLRVQDLCMRVLTQQISPSLNRSRISILQEYLLQMNLSFGSLLERDTPTQIRSWDGST